MAVLEMKNRLIDPIFLHQGTSQVIMRPGVIGSKPDGCLELGNGFVDLSLPYQDEAGMVVQFFILRLRTR